MRKKPASKHEWALHRMLKNEEIWGWGSVILLTILLFGMTAFLMPITYTYIASDDRFLANYLAGYWSGTPEASLPFINPIFAGAVSSLYRLAPNIHWYADLHIAVLFLSYVLIARCVFVTAKHGSSSPWIALLTNLAIYASAFCYNVTWLSFTVTPALACTAVASVILCREKPSERRWLGKSILCVALLILAYLWRSSSAQVGLCFCAGALVYRVFMIGLGQEGNRKSAYIKIGGAVLAVAVFLSVSSIAMWAHTNDPALEEYYAFRAACVQYLDYPGAVRYADDEELYEEVGVSEPLENLMNHWFFMDNSIDAECLNALAGVDNPDRVESFLDFHQSPTQALKTARDLFLTDRNARLLLYPCLLMFLMGCVLFARDRKARWLEFAILVCFSLGSAVLCFYLCLLGRFPIRTFVIIASPYLVMSILLNGKMRAAGSGTKRPLPDRCICGLLLALAIASAACTGAVSTLSGFDRGAKHNCINQSVAMDQIALENPDNIYIFDFQLAMSNEAWPDYSSGRPTNLFYWGGSYLGTDAFARQMALNQISSFDASLFLQGNVYFLTAEYMGERNALMKYMMMEYGAATCTRVDTLADGLIGVYKFEGGFDKTDYTGWHESYGQRVYYEKGKAQSGLFEVNGRKYYGLPYEPGVEYITEDPEAGEDTERFLCKLYSVASGLVLAEDHEYYYFDPDYRMVTGWVKFGDNWRYFGKDGAGYRNRSLTEDGFTYVFNADGTVADLLTESAPGNFIH